MRLLQTQKIFATSVAKLIQRAIELGFEVTIGECERPPEMAAIYAAEGKGIVDSLHEKRLAIDLNLFRGVVFLTGKQDYRALGDYWKSLSSPDAPHFWGGDFDVPDSDHFSVSPDGGRTK